jgi:hypothetical protein
LSHRFTCKPGQIQACPHNCVTVNTPAVRYCELGTNYDTFDPWTDNLAGPQMPKI